MIVSALLLSVTAISPGCGGGGGGSGGSSAEIVTHTVTTASWSTSAASTVTPVITDTTNDFNIAPGGAAPVIVPYPPVDITSISLSGDDTDDAGRGDDMADDVADTGLAAGDRADTEAEPVGRPSRKQVVRTLERWLDNVRGASA